MILFREHLKPMNDNQKHRGGGGRQHGRVFPWAHCAIAAPLQHRFIKGNMLPKVSNTALFHLKTLFRG